MSKTIDIIARKTATKTALNSQGNLSVMLTEPSVVQIHGAPADVARYVRQGKDLLIYMKDGSVIRCSNYFDAFGEEGMTQSELVFMDDSQQLTHITFGETGESLGMGQVALTPQATTITSIEPFIEQGVLENMPWGWIAGGLLVGGGVGALLANGDGGGHSTTVIDNTTPVETAKPSFVVSDDQGDKQGVLSSNALTDDTTPVFSGTGQPGSTIQIKDSNGDTIASAMVSTDGTWSVVLPAQAAGTHTWSVVQIEGSKTTAGGSITLEVVTAEASITPGTISSDNVVNASEAASAVVVSGQSQALAAGTALTVTLNGKTYTTEVGTNGNWQVSVPATDMGKLAQGSHQVTVKGTDSTGNTITGEQTLTVDTRAPGATIDKLTDDNVVNSVELATAQSLSGTTDAEEGQTVSVKIGDQQWTTTVLAGGKWQIAIDADALSSLPQGENAVSVTVSDKAGNATTTAGSITISSIGPTLTVDSLTADNVLNAQEQSEVQILSGSTDAAPGSKVEVTLNGTTIIGAISSDGNWSAPLTTALIAQLQQGNHTAQITITDAAGNVSSGSHTFTLAAETPVIEIDDINGAQTLNADSVSQPLTISGTTNLDPGTPLTVTLNGNTYSSSVETAPDGSSGWSVVVPVDDLLSLDNTTYSVTVEGENAIGNVVETTGTLVVDTLSPTVTLNTVAGDNLLGVDEVATEQVISGTVNYAKPGDKVAVSLNGILLGNAEVQNDMSWELEVTSEQLKALGDSQVNITATVTNYSGNSATTHGAFVISASLPGLGIDIVSGDDIINAIELNQSLTLSGTSSHIQAGTTVTLDINGQTFTAQIGPGGRWQTGITSEQLQALVQDQTSLTIVATADDSFNQATGTHGVTVDLNPVAVSINPATGDDMLNAAEKGAGITLDGQTQNVEAGQTVVIRIGNATLTATVERDGSWRTEVSADVLSNLSDGAATVQASVTNVSGNTAGSSRQLTVDTVAPTIGIGSLTDDNVLNAAEATDPNGQTLTGTTTAEPGQEVTISINGQSWPTTVADDGTWSVQLPASGLSTLEQGAQSVIVTVKDRAGNSTSTSQSVLVDTLAPQISIDDFTADNVINQSEHALAQVISGTSAGGVAGDSVSVTLWYGTGADAQQQTFITVLDAAGRWSIGVSAADIQALAGGEAKISAALTDKAGNTGTSEKTFTVSLIDPEITINTDIARDDVINAIEKGENLVIGGVSNQPGRPVTVTLNGREYHTTADGNGAWSVTVLPADLAQLGEATYTIAASVVDSVGNSSSTSHQVVVDTAAPQVVITGLDGGNDNIINKSELLDGETLKGYVVNAEADSVVTVTVGGITKTTTVGSDGQWSISLTADELTSLGDGELMFNAEVTNAHGNTGSGQYQAVIDAEIPGIRIDTVAGDDVVNLIEQGAAVVISGTVIGVDTGADVNVKVNNQTYTTTLHADGTWSITVPAVDVARWPNVELTIAASVADSAGNTGSWQHTIDVDLDAVAISVGSVTADNVINAQEQGETLLLQGTTLGVEAGRTVTILFGGQQYTTTVAADGSWQYTLSPSDLSALREGDASVQVSVSNQNGNQASSAQDYHVDLSAPTLLVDAVTGNNVINASEATSGFVITGQSNAETGQVGSLTWDGVPYTFDVQADGSWSVQIPATEAALAQGAQNIVVTLSDKAGNSTSLTQAVLVDTQAPVVTIDNVGGSDNTLNSSEHRQSQIISGSVSGASAGDSVTVTVGSGDSAWSITTVLDAAGRWSVGMPASAVSLLDEGGQAVSVSVTDTAGNTGTGTHTFEVALTAPEIAIDAVDNSGVINAQMSDAGITVTGTSNQFDVEMTLTLNGKNYTATTDAAGGNWSITLSPAELALLGEAGYTLVASITDAAGNTASASQAVLVDTASPVLTINGLNNNDDVINIDELTQTQQLTGSTRNVEAGKYVTITIGGVDHDAQVDANGEWTLDLPSTLLEALGDGRLTATATVTNEHGNSASSEYQFTIDIEQPGIRIDTVSGDDVINIIEHQQDLVISGSTERAVAGEQVQVTVNGVAHTTRLLDDGSWTLTVGAQEVAGWSDPDVVITASVANVNGNQSEIGHNVTLDLSATAIAIDPITADDVLNQAEHGGVLSLGGAVAGIEDGQSVTVLFAGHRYEVAVADGLWSLDVVAADMGSLKDGEASISVSASNVNGNSASAERQFVVDLTAPTLSVNTLAGDNQINAGEATAGYTLSGTSSAEPGQTVSLTWLGNPYTAEIDADGNWSVSVDGVTDATTLDQGLQTLSLSVQDKAGNSTSQTHSVNIDTLVPELTLTPVTGDNKLNATELGQAQIIAGTCLNAEPGAVVTVTFNGKSYSTVLDENQNWQLGIPAPGDLSAGDYPLTVTVTDNAGNSNTLTSPISVVLALPKITINQVAQDDVVNDAEKAAGITISGTSDQIGREILVTLNGRDYTATASGTGDWQVTVSPVDLAALGEASYLITASVTDETGNYQSASRPVTVDTAAPQITITPLPEDDVINVGESEAEQRLSGTVKNAETGSQVVVTLGGQTFNTTVAEGGVWEITIPANTFSAFGDGPLTATATVTNARGNSGSTQYELSVNTGIPGLRIDTVAGDDVVNILEAQEPVVISGTSTGMDSGQDVTVTVSETLDDGSVVSTTYTTQVNAEGRWSVIVPVDDASQWRNGELTVVATATNSAGNDGSSIGRLVEVDLNAVAIGIDPITDDNVINAQERGDGITLSGTTSGIEVGQTVTITFGGQQYSAEVGNDGSWHTGIPATALASLRDGTASVVVSVNSVNGNQAEAARQYDVDTSAPALSVASVADNNVINLAEADGGFEVSGFSGAEQGQRVEVEWNGVAYFGEVGSNGAWSITLPAAQSELEQGDLDLEFSVTDLAGNVTTLTHTATVDTLAPVIAVDDITTDDILNATEHGQAQVISGTCTEAEVGAIVTVTLNGASYTTALDSNKAWSVGIPASAVSSLAEGENALVVTVTDSAGNTGRYDGNVVVNTTLPVIAINTVASDDIINLAEKGQDLAISGSSDQPNQAITVSLNGVLYQTTADGGTVPGLSPYRHRRLPCWAKPATALPPA